MPVIVSLENQLPDISPLENVVHITTSFKPADTLPIKIAKMGMALEQYLLETRIDDAVLIWSKYELDPAITAISKLPKFRNDELWFSTLDMGISCGYVAGHVNAIAKWAATCRDIDSLNFVPWPQNKGYPSDTASLIWWAQRINLRVYGYHL